MDKLRITGEMQTSRQYNLDLLKAFGIIGMLICHAVLQLGMHHTGYEQDLEYLIGDIFFGDYFGVAHAFMFAMGVGVNYTKKSRPSDLIRRGIWLYVLGFVLNFFRYGVYTLLDGLIEGEFMTETIYSLVVQDILHFAGLALIATGLFLRMKLTPVHIAVIGVILSALGGPLAFTCQGGTVSNYFIGHFITTTEAESCFVFFNWYIFVAAGLLFGMILRRTEHLDTLYRRLLRAALPVMVFYIVLTLLFGPLFLTKHQWYYATSLPESIGLLSIDLTLLSAFHFLLKKVDASILSTFITMGHNLTSIYCIHWCIIGFVDSIFCYLLEIVFPYWVAYLFGVLLIPVAYRMSKWWTNWKQRRKGSTISKRDE